MLRNKRFGTVFYNRVYFEALRWLHDFLQLLEFVFIYLSEAASTGCRATK